MAKKTRDGIYVTKNTVTPNLKLVNQNIAKGMESGVHESMAKSTDAMYRKVDTSTTPTGFLRASGADPRYSRHSDGRPVAPAWYDGRGPGRRETDKMISSIKSVTKARGNQVTGKAGFIDAPDYTAIQDIGTRSVKGMRAFAAGHTVMSAVFDPTMIKHVGQAVHDANSGKKTKGTI